jgi:hypothetical protein
LQGISSGLGPASAGGVDDPLYLLDADRDLPSDPSADGGDIHACAPRDLRVAEPSMLDELGQRVG